MRQSTKDAQAIRFFESRSTEVLLNMAFTGSPDFERARSQYRVAGGKDYKDDGRPDGYLFNILRMRDKTFYTTDRQIGSIKR